MFLLVVNESFLLKASSLPLSIIIVGVGYDSFGEMKVLDSDRQMLQVNGKYAKRDIVQVITFVIIFNYTKYKLFYQYFD